MNIINVSIVFLTGLVIGLIYARAYIVKRMRTRRAYYGQYSDRRRSRRPVISSFNFILIISVIIFTAFFKHKARSDVAKPIEEQGWTKTLEEDRPAEEINTSF